MKSYARRNKRQQLNVKYRWRGIAKSNTRKHNGRRKYAAMDTVYNLRAANMEAREKM